mmetsp:Transcript_4638/g.7441  ORF Transcript_4638/g.7441 Transcript_4638/m.7441 type:complete len:82 (-) Transcript_4638:1339-1584(-)
MPREHPAGFKTGNAEREEEEQAHAVPQVHVLPNASWLRFRPRRCREGVIAKQQNRLTLGFQIRNPSTDHRLITWLMLNPEE